MKGVDVQSGVRHRRSRGDAPERERRFHRHRVGDSVSLTGLEKEGRRDGGRHGRRRLRIGRGRRCSDHDHGPARKRSDPGPTDRYGRDDSTRRRLTGRPWWWSTNESHSAECGGGVMVGQRGQQPTDRQTQDAQGQEIFGRGEWR